MTNVFVDEDEAARFKRACAARDEFAAEQEFAAETDANEILSGGLGGARPSRKPILSATEEREQEHAARIEQIRKIVDATLQPQPPESPGKHLAAF